MKCLKKSFEDIDQNENVYGVSRDEQMNKIYVFERKKKRKEKYHLRVGSS